MWININLILNNTSSTYDLYSDLDNYMTPIATGLTYSELTNNYVMVVDDNTTIIRVKSVGGLCNNFYEDFTITMLPTPTPTMTSTPTTTPTQTSTPTITPTQTSTPTPTNTPTSVTPTPTPTHLTSSEYIVTNNGTGSVTIQYYDINNVLQTIVILAGLSQIINAIINSITCISGDCGNVTIELYVSPTPTPTSTPTLTPTKTPTPTPTSTTIPSCFNIGNGVNYTILSICSQSDDKIIIGGNFSTYNGISANGIARLNSYGSIDTSFVYGTGFNGIPYSIHQLSDGKLLIGGGFHLYNGTTSNAIIKLNTNGSIDTSFNIGTGFSLGYLTNINIQSDGKILAVGNFSVYNGTNANRIIRLNSDGSVDTSFNIGTGFNSEPNSVLQQSDGKILVGGNFYTYNGVNASKIIRLNSDGSIDTSFVYGTGFDQTIESIVLQSDGKIIIGGHFTLYNGTSRNRIIRLNSDGSVDTSFNIGNGFSSNVQVIFIESDGKILVGGAFTSYNGTSSSKIIRLNTNGSVDTGFNIGTGFGCGDFGCQVEAICQQSTGKIVVGGSFESYNGVIANKIIRLNYNGTINNC